MAARQSPRRLAVWGSATCCHGSRFPTNSAAKSSETGGTADFRSAYLFRDRGSRLKPSGAPDRTGPDVTAGAHHPNVYCQLWFWYQESSCLRVSSLAIPYRSWMIPSSFSWLPLICVRSSSVSFPHCCFTAPFICFQFPSTRFQSIAASFVEYTTTCSSILFQEEVAGGTGAVAYGGIDG